MQQTTPKLWIFDLRVDAVCFVATPLLIVPLVALTRTQLSVMEISLLVATLGATGHHLPGLIRAYGDRELFRRFRNRFVLAPILILAYCVWLSGANPSALTAVVVIWGTWHALTQVFGIARIYDVRVGSTSPLTASLDRWMCVSWFGAGFFFSDGRMADLFEMLYAAGLPLIGANEIFGFRAFWGSLTAAITLAFFANFTAKQFRGVPASPIKIPLLAASFGFWWYAMVAIDNAILGVALFELFHDVQYLAISWTYNRKRVEAGRQMGSFSRFLFKPARLKVALYIGLSLGYGFAIHQVGEFGLAVFRDGTLARALISVAAASTILHFYYDGFIWKLRDRSTRSGLGLGGGVDRARSVGLDLSHALKWGMLLAPTAALIVAQQTGSVSVLEMRRSVVETFPTATTHVKLGIALLDLQLLDQAGVEFRSARAGDPASTPNLAIALFNLGNAHFRRGQLSEAVDLYREALALAPDREDFRAQLDRTLARQKNEAP